MPTNRLMALQVASVSNLEPSGSRGVDALSASDAAACASGLERRLYLAARVRWCADATCVVELSRALWIDACGLAAERRWIVETGGERLRALAELAVLEMLEPRIYGSMAARLEFTGYKPVEWWRTWQERYVAIYDTLARWTDHAGAHMTARQEESDEVAP